MDKRRMLIFGVAGGLWLTAVVLSLCMGAARLSLAQLWQAVCGGAGGTAGYIFWYARLPRTAACLLAGGALAVSGGVIQSVLHNPLASPGIIGINAGAGLAVTACCAMGSGICLEELFGPIGYGLKTSCEEAERLRLVYEAETANELSVIVEPLNSINNILCLREGKYSSRECETNHFYRCDSLTAIGISFFGESSSFHAADTAAEVESRYK